MSIDMLNITDRDEMLSYLRDLLADRTSNRDAIRSTIFFIRANDYEGIWS